MASALGYVAAHLAGWLGISESPIAELGFATFLAVVAFFSQWGMERWYGGSVGKQLLGVAVVDANGARPSSSKLLARFFLRFPGFFGLMVPEGVAGFQYADLAFNILQLAAIAAGIICWPIAGRRTLSDVLTHTRVAYEEPPTRRPPPERHGGEAAQRGRPTKIPTAPAPSPTSSIASPRRASRTRRLSPGARRTGPASAPTRASSVPTSA